MDPRAIYIGLLLAAVGILFGYQAYFFLCLRMEREIGGIRFGFLFFTIIISLTFVVTHLNSPYSLLVMFLPLIFWAPLRLRDKVIEKKFEKEFEKKETEKWERTIEIDPKNVGAYIALGDIYTKRRKFDKAISYYQNAFRLHQSSSIQLKLKKALAEKNGKPLNETPSKGFIATVGKKEL